MQSYRQNTSQPSIEKWKNLPGKTKDNFKGAYGYGFRNGTEYTISYEDRIILHCGFSIYYNILVGLFTAMMLSCGIGLYIFVTIISASDPEEPTWVNIPIKKPRILCSFDPEDDPFLLGDLMNSSRCKRT
jgi:hypothetical protein